METEKRNNKENDARDENRMGRKQQKMKKLLFKGFMFIGNTTQFSRCNLR